MQLIKQVIGSGNQFGTVDIIPDTIPSNPALGIMLVGMGGVGNGSSSALDILVNSEIPKGVKDSADKYGIIWICPQTGAVYNQGEIDFAIAMGLKRYGIDPKRIYLSGFSLGGGATFGYAMQSLANAKRLAAIAPMATTWPVGDVKNIADAGLPVWAAHNINDTNGGTKYAATVNTIAAINALNPAVKAAYTGMNRTGHGSWSEFTDVNTIPIPAGSEGFINPPYNLYQWFLMNSLGNPVAAGGPLINPQPAPLPAKTEKGRIFVDSLGKFVVVYSDGSTSQQ